MAPQFLPVVNQAPTVGANQNAYLNAARGYIPDPATAAGLGLPQQYTTYQASDGDPEVMRQAYAEQEARLGPMRLPSKTSDDGLGLTPTTRAMPVSSGGDSDWNWLTAIGAGLQSAGAAHFGNFDVPRQYLQMKAMADQRKEQFAQQQAQLAEQKRQHDMTSAIGLFTNPNVSWTEKKKGLANLPNNPLAFVLSKVGDEELAAQFDTVRKYINPEVLQNIEKDPEWARQNLSRVASEVGFAKDRMKKDSDFQVQNARIEDIKQRFQANQPVTLIEMQELEKAVNEREQMALKTAELREKLQRDRDLHPGNVAKGVADARHTQALTNLANAPKEAYSAPVDQAGNVETGVWDPQTQALQKFTGQKPAGVNVSIDTRKFSPEQAGRVGAMNSAIESLQGVRDKLIKPDGTVDRTTLFTSNLFGGLPFTEGRDVNRLIEDAVETKLRLETGAAANKDEVKRIAQRYRPSNADSDDTIIGKLAGLERYMQQSFNVLDPTGEVRSHISGNKIGVPPVSFDQAYGELKKKGMSKEEIFKELERRGVKP